MTSGYTKLFASILASSIWSEDKDTKIVWVTLLAAANKDGVVEASIPGIAALARLEVAEVRAAISKLEAPDPDSRTKDFDGRRIEPIDGGWLLLNHAKYRAKLGSEERREYFREKKREQRDREKSKTVKDSQRQVPVVTQSEAEAEAEAEAGKTNNVRQAGQRGFSPESRSLVNYLNEKTGSKFRESKESLKPIDARLKEQDVTLDGCKTMIDRQCSMWKGTEMEIYLRPSTLFGPSKFNEYYATKDLPLPKSKANPASVLTGGGKSRISQLRVAGPSRLERLNMKPKDGEKSRLNELEAIQHEWLDAKEDQG